MAAKKIRILAGAIVRQEPEVFQAFLKLLTAQQIPESATLDLAFTLDSADNDILNKALEKAARSVKAKIHHVKERPENAIYAVGPDTHIWTNETFVHLAAEKHAFCQRALQEGYDYIWLVDSDLLLEPTVLTSLLCCYRPIASAVFWTEWQNGKPQSLGPNVWLKHPYGQESFELPQGLFWDRLARRQMLEVAGGGACILIHRTVYEKGAHYAPILASLPAEGLWRGEDRTFSIRAERLHVKQFADGWPDIYHAYHPQDRTTDALKEVMDFFQAPRQERAKYGDLVNFALENLEEPRAKDIILGVRGRLGALKVLPEIEDILIRTRVGEEAIFEARFPSWEPPIQPRPDQPPLLYAGQKKVLRLRFIDAKPYGFAPVLAKHMFAGMRATNG